MKVFQATTWQFTSTDQRNLQLSIGSPPAAIYNWIIVQVTDQALHNTTAVGNNILVTARYKANGATQ